MLQALAARVVTAANVLAGAVTVAIFLVMAAQGVSRYGFNTSLFWAEEVAVVLFVWMGFLGAASTEANNGHIRLTLLVERLSPRLRQINETLVEGVLLVMLVLLVASAPSGLATLQTTVALRLSEKWLYAIVPVTMALCALHIVLRLLRRLRSLPNVGA